MLERGRAYWYRGNHGGAAVASEAVSQHRGHHGVAVGDVRAPGARADLLQRNNHLLQVVEGQVDVLGLGTCPQNPHIRSSHARCGVEKYPKNVAGELASEREHKANRNSKGDKTSRQENEY